MIRTTLGTTLIAPIARGTRCLLVAATMALTTPLIGEMVQSPAAAHANGNWHKPVRIHVTHFTKYSHTFHRLGAPMRDSWNSWNF